MHTIDVSGSSQLADLTLVISTTKWYADNYCYKTGRNHNIIVSSVECNF